MQPTPQPEPQVIISVEQASAKPVASNNTAVINVVPTAPSQAVAPTQVLAVIATRAPVAIPTAQPQATAVLRPSEPSASSQTVTQSAPTASGNKPRWLTQLFTRPVAVAIVPLMVILVGMVIAGVVQMRRDHA